MVESDEDELRPQDDSWQLAPKSVQEQVENKLRIGILKGNFSIGERLVENDLAELLGVSRGPTRAALQQLTAEGLVDHIPRVGRFVHVPTVDEIQEIQEIRGVLEGLAANKVASRAADPDDRAWLERLDVVVEEMRLASAENDQASYFRLSREFHVGLISLAGSSVLQRFHNFVMNRATLFRQLSGSIDRRQEEAVKEHAGIMQAITNADGEEAERLIREHSAHGAVAIQEALKIRAQASETRNK